MTNLVTHFMKWLKCLGTVKSVLKTHPFLAGPDCQHGVIDEFLCMVSGCALETDVCHWMFKTKVNIVQGQEDAPLRDCSRDRKKQYLKTGGVLTQVGHVQNRESTSNFAIFYMRTIVTFFAHADCIHEIQYKKCSAGSGQ